VIVAIAMPVAYMPYAINYIDWFKIEICKIITINILELDGFHIFIVNIILIYQYHCH